MIILSYDFHSNKTRRKFAKLAEQYGDRIQYSVFMIRNSPRVLRALLIDIEMKFKRKIKSTDSVYVFKLCNGCKEKVVRYGSAKHVEEAVVYLN